MSMNKKKIRLEDGRYLIYFSFNGAKIDEKKEKSAQKSCCSGECCGGKK